jgi:hypothetical protein
VLTDGDAVAVVNPRGADAPRSCVVARTSAGEKAICAMHKRTSGQERRALARHGCGKHVCADTSALVRRTADGACADRHCIRVQRCREGPTLVPAPAFRDFQSLCSRAVFPRGAYAPRSCIGMRTCASEKTIFAMHKRTPEKERRASARRGVPETHLQHRYRTRSGTLVSRGNRSGGR